MRVITWSGDEMCQPNSDESARLEIRLLTAHFYKEHVSVHTKASLTVNAYQPGYRLELSHNACK